MREKIKIKTIGATKCAWTLHISTKRTVVVPGYQCIWLLHFYKRKWVVSLLMTSLNEHFLGKYSGMGSLCCIPVPLLPQKMMSLLCSWSIYHLASPGMVAALNHQWNFHQFSPWLKPNLNRMYVVTYFGGTRSERTICLINYNRIAYVVHFDIFKCHIGGCTATRWVSPCLNPNTIHGPCHGAVSDNKAPHISFIRVSSQTSNAVLHYMLWITG